MNKQISKPDYELFKNGISDENRIVSILKAIGDQVLIALVVSCGLCLYSGSTLLAGFSISLMFLWGMLRYIKWPDKKRLKERHEDSP